MYTIASLLEAQAEAVGDSAAGQALQDASSRVKSMMTIYDRLYRSGDYERIDTQEYLTALLSDIGAAHQRPGVNVRLISEIEPIEIETRFSFPLAIIVNEWVTNAYKYAFPAGRAGTIRVSLRYDGPRQLELCVTDDGPGLPPSVDVAAPESFGLRLVQILQRQLRGALQVSRSNGTLYQMLIPLPAPPAPGE
jgi:two-component sensor histidine kinase